MDFRFANLTWLLAGAVCIAAFSAASQGGVQPAQAPLFANPGDGAQTPVDPFTDTGSYANTVQAPTFGLNSRPAGPLPPVQNFSPQLNQLLQDRKNWALMTPEEILGVSTPEEILGVKKPEDIEQSSYTPEERFLLRQDASSAKATAEDGANNFSHWSLTKTPDSSVGTSQPGMPNDSSFSDFSRLLNASSSNPFKRQDNSGNGIQAPAQAANTAKANLEQQAAMERFRQLLDPDPAPSKPVATSPGYRFDSSSATPGDAYLKARASYDPLYNPLGASVSPLRDNAEKPIGITPLPGIATQPPKKLETPPSWTPKPPPWLSHEPNPFVLPQPKL